MNLATLRGLVSRGDGRAVRKKSVELFDLGAVPFRAESTSSDRMIARGLPFQHGGGDGESRRQAPSVLDIAGRDSGHSRRRQFEFLVRSRLPEFMATPGGSRSRYRSVPMADPELTLIHHAVQSGRNRFLPVRISVCGLTC